MARRRKGIPGVSFSWKRALGVTAAKQKIARATGIPTTRQGRQRKAGAAMGCCIPFMFLMLGFGATLSGIKYLVTAFIA